jgi:hypothetical protein
LRALLAVFNGYLISLSYCAMRLIVKGIHVYADDFSLRIHDFVQFALTYSQPQHKISDGCNVGFRFISHDKTTYR